jgi:hypothetical protein
MKLKDIIQNPDKKHSLKDLKIIKGLLKSLDYSSWRSSKEWFISKRLENEFGMTFDDYNYHSSAEIAGARGEEN